MKTRILIYFLSALVGWQSDNAQKTVRHKIALFAPLYLDSAFDANDSYRFGTSFPKYINPGLEFYLGAQAALDSLEKVGAPIEAFVYDTKAAQTSLAQQLAKPEMSNMELMIGQTSATETRLLAEEAARNKVPFISATLPNDAGVNSNPYYVVLNTTLRAHCEGIYKYLQKYHPLDKITLFTKAGTQEAELKSYFQEYAKATAGAPLKVSFVDIGPSAEPALVMYALDSTRKNFCISGSLDLAFGQDLMQQLAGVSKIYPITVIGMPTWDAMNFAKPEFKSVETIYTSPFYYARTTPLSTRLAAEFTAKQVGRPTDMFYRGYETTLRFALLLLDTKKDVASNLTRKGNNIFTAFDIQPVFLDRSKPELDYFENKKLYFVRVANGVKNLSNF